MPSTAETSLRRWLLPGLVAALLTPAVGQAQEASSVRTVALCQAPEGEPRTAAALCAWLERAWGAGGARLMIEVDRSLIGASDFDPVPALETAKKTLENAQSAEAIGRHTRARAFYGEAADALMELDPWLTDRGQLADALLGLARTAQQGRSRDRWMADEAIVRLMNVVPGWRARVAEEPQALRDRVAEMEATVREQPLGALLVESTPPGARLVVDGEFVGVTPMVVERLTAGEHLVSVRRAGNLPQARRAVVAPNDRARLSVELSAAQGGVAFAQASRRALEEVGAPRSGDGLGELRSLLLVEQAVAVRISPDPSGDGELIEGYVYDLRSRQLLSQAVVVARLDTPTRARAAAEELAEALEQALDAGAASPGGEEGSVLSSWWFWTGAGAAVLGVVGATWWLTRDDAGGAGASEEPLPPGTGTIRLVF